MSSSAQAKAFIQKIAPLIREEAKARGYKLCSPIIAQAVIESRYGESGLAKYNNFFGLKCGTSWKGSSVNMRTKEEYNSQLVSIRDNFRTFPTFEAGVKGYFDFISTKRYANLKTAETPEEYLKRIKADGFATSSRYVQTNMDCVRKYDLEKWDWNSIAKDVNPYEEPQRNLKRICRGEDVKWVQWELQRRGINIGDIDGIYGQRTYTGVCIFQKKCDGRLAVDGIVGRNTISELKKR